MAEQSKKRHTSRGKCSLCGGTFGKGGMKRHLGKCLEKQGLVTKPEGGKAGKARAFHLVVGDRYYSEYWLHLLVAAKATLADLDGFLRDIWVECCGHLSSFTIGRSTFDSGPPMGLGEFGDDEYDDDVFDDEDEFEDYGKEFGYVEESVLPGIKKALELLGIPLGSIDLEKPKTRDMNVEMGEVLYPKLKFDYEYDFGSTTYLTLNVAGEWEGAVKGGRIQLLARNDPPEIPCGECGKPAVSICVDCTYDEEGWLCKACARKHECGEDLLLPVVNSPRTGVCGYTG